jgi:hypothetical protein
MRLLQTRKKGLHRKKWTSAEDQILMRVYGYWRAYYQNRLPGFLELPSELPAARNPPSAAASSATASKPPPPPPTPPRAAPSSAAHMPQASAAETDVEMRDSKPTASSSSALPPLALRESSAAIAASSMPKAIAGTGVGSAVALPVLAASVLGSVTADQCRRRYGKRRPFRSILRYLQNSRFLVFDQRS